MLRNDISHAASAAIPDKGYVLPASSCLGTLFGKNNYFGFFFFSNGSYV